MVTAFESMLPHAQKKRRQLRTSKYALFFKRFHTMIEPCGSWA